MVIPAAWVITVRLVSPLKTSSKTGEAFTAVVPELITVGGDVVVPSGVAAGGHVIDVKREIAIGVGKEVEGHGVGKGPGVSWAEGGGQF